MNELHLHLDQSPPTRRRAFRTLAIRLGLLLACTAWTACGEDNDEPSDDSTEQGQDAGDGSPSDDDDDTSDSDDATGMAGSQTDDDDDSDEEADEPDDDGESDEDDAEPADDEDDAEPSDDEDDGDEPPSDDVDAGAGDDDDDDTDEDGDSEQAEMGFFVTSDTNETGDLGGLDGADERCQDLAEAVGAGERTWHAYLSAEDEDGEPIHARDRIGEGPWYNSRGVLLAQDLDELHSLSGDPDLFLDENGEKINGQWDGSPSPNQHDILTGSQPDGTLLEGSTCRNWNSSSANDYAQVGHSDGLGPQGDDGARYRSWNSVHQSQDCSDTEPRGGAGKVYCFALD